MKFSVLLSIYHQENAAFFNIAMQSIWDEQTLKPTEIILVEDGKLTTELYVVIEQWQQKLVNVLKRVPLSENQGLGKALNIGLQHCQYEYVARMDTDDICTPDRFEKQMAFLANNPEIDVLGGQIIEFNQKIGDSVTVRKLPCAQIDIIKFAKKRNPFNHPTIIYKKALVQKVGSYQSEYLFEDYALWVRMICKGAQTANLEDVLLYMRCGDGLYQRRGGVDYAIAEFKIQRDFYHLGFLSKWQLLLNLLIRMPIRLLPNSLRTYFYKQFLRTRF